MFKCQMPKCNYRGKTYEAPTRVTLVTRPKAYENVISRGKKKFTVRSEGTEIVLEAAVCASCVEKLSNDHS